MEVLQSKPPVLNPDDVKSAFRDITQYLYNIMETIDFTLSRNKNGLSDADAGLSVLQTVVDGYSAEIQRVTDLAKEITKTAEELSQKVDDLKAEVDSYSASISSINGKITSLESRVTELESSVSSLNSRVAALENPNS